MLIGRVQYGAAISGPECTSLYLVAQLREESQEIDLSLEDSRAAQSRVERDAGEVSYLIREHADHPDLMQQPCSTCCALDRVPGIRERTDVIPSASAPDPVHT